MVNTHISHSSSCSSSQVVQRARRHRRHQLPVGCPQSMQPGSIVAPPRYCCLHMYTVQAACKSLLRRLASRVASSMRAVGWRLASRIMKAVSSALTTECGTSEALLMRR